MHTYEVVCITVSFIGIAILSLAKPSSGGMSTKSESQYLVGVIFAIITMVLMATLVVSGRALKGVNATVVQLHYAFFGSLFAGSLMLLFSKVPDERSLLKYPDSSTYWLLLVMGITNSLAMFLFIYNT